MVILGREITTSLHPDVWSLATKMVLLTKHIPWGERVLPEEAEVLTNGSWLQEGRLEGCHEDNSGRMSSLPQRSGSSTGVKGAKHWWVVALSSAGEQLEVQQAAKTKVAPGTRPADRDYYFSSPLFVCRSQGISHASWWKKSGIIRWLESMIEYNLMWILDLVNWDYGPAAVGTGWYRVFVFDVGFN